VQQKSRDQKTWGQTKINKLGKLVYLYLDFMLRQEKIAATSSGLRNKIDENNKFWWYKVLPRRATNFPCCVMSEWLRSRQLHGMRWQCSRVLTTHRIPSRSRSHPSDSRHPSRISSEVLRLLHGGREAEKAEKAAVRVQPPWASI